MKRLTLLRHAKSDWDDPVARDFDRPLNHRGEKAALLMGQFAAQRQMQFDMLVASPAVRVSKHRQMKVVISRDVKHLIMPEGPVIPDASDEAAPNEGRRDVGPRAKSRKK